MNAWGPEIPNLQIPDNLPTGNFIFFQNCSPATFVYLTLSHQEHVGPKEVHDNWEALVEQIP